MKQLIIFITLIALLTAAKTKSAEVIPVWDKIWKQGSPQFTNRIHDFEFLRGEDQFIMIAGVGELGALEIRETLTGELVTSFPLPTASYFNQIEITPDSSRIVITTGGDKVNSPAIELRSIENFELIKKLDIKMDDDSVDNVGQPYYFVFKDILIDPVKPYIYAFITKTNYYDDDDLDRTWLKVYNYESMEEVRDLTPVGYEYELMKCMDVSDDGRQLAVLNEGKAYLKVWDTETFELTLDKQLYDDNYTDIDDYWCKADDIEFSSINNDLIYFSGKYPIKGKDNFYPYGLFFYRFFTNTFKKEFESINNLNGEFILYNNEDKIIISDGSMFAVIDNNNGSREIFENTNIKYPIGDGNIYSDSKKIIIGKTEYIIAGFRYDSQTNTEVQYEEEIIISPNPTNNFINISPNCSEPQINYQINDVNGLLISESSIEYHAGSLQINFMPYPAGVYFLTINCNVPKTYKVVKEG